LCLRDILVAFDIDILILHRPPESLNEDIIKASASAVHADGYVTVTQYLRECFACELAALIGIKNLRLAVLKSVFEALDAEVIRKSI
jgi:hypothetical protein